jgi:hypothetical protein
LELHPISSESSPIRNGAHIHVFQTLTSGLWNLTAARIEFLVQLVELAGVAALKWSLGDQMRTNVQIAAQSRGITDLHDNEMWAAPNFLFGVFICDCAASTDPL